MKPPLRDRLRDALRRFLGLGDMAYANEADVAPRIGRRLLQEHRIFGDPARVELGAHVILNDALINTSSGHVRLEDYAFCGHAVSLLTGTHDYRQVDYLRQAGVPQQGRDIHIGRGVWLGSNATVLGPCRIGANAVIAAGAVVVGDVEEGGIYAGVPARRIGRIDTAPGEQNDNDQKKEQTA